MTQQGRSSKPNCTIEFRVYDDERFLVLGRFFSSLQAYTRGQGGLTDDIPDDVTQTARSARPSDDTQESYAIAHEDTQVRRSAFRRPEEWLLALRPKDLDFLGLPDHKSAVEAIRSWQGLSRRERRRAIKSHADSDRLRQLADFIDMLRYWQDVEYELISCEKTDSDRAQIVYSTFGFPFEGKVALEELLIFFGFLSIINDTC